MKTVIIYAEQGQGKTRNAEKLKTHFGCLRIVDDFRLGQPLQPGDLALTHDATVLEPFRPSGGIEVYRLAEALMAAEHA